MEYIHEMVVSFELLKALGFPSCSLASFTEVDDMGEGLGEQGLGGMIGRAGRGVGRGDSDGRDRWGWAARNSSAVGMLSSRVNEESSLQARELADYC